MIPSSFQTKVGLLTSRNLTILETLGVTKATSKTVSIILTCFPSVQTFNKRIRSRKGRSSTKTMINVRIIEVTTIVSTCMINFLFQTCKIGKIILLQFMTLNTWPNGKKLSIVVLCTPKLLSFSYLNLPTQKVLSFLRRTMFGLLHLGRLKSWLSNSSFARLSF